MLIKGVVDMMSRKRSDGATGETLENFGQGLINVDNDAYWSELTLIKGATQRNSHATECFSIRHDASQPRVLAPNMTMTISHV